MSRCTNIRCVMDFNVLADNSYAQTVYAVQSATLLASLLCPWRSKSTGGAHLLLGLVKGALPLGAVCLLLWSLTKTQASSSISVAVVLGVYGVILWFGWSGIQNNIVTKWFGILLALSVGLILSIFILGIAIQVSLVLFVPFLVALPFLAYDLLFRSPLRVALLMPALSDAISVHGHDSWRKISPICFRHAGLASPQKESRPHRAAIL